MQSSALRHKHLLFAICRKAHSTVFRKQCSSRFLGQNFRLYIFKRNYGSQPSNSVNRYQPNFITFTALFVIRIRFYVQHSVNKKHIIVTGVTGLVLWGLKFMHKLIHQPSSSRDQVQNLVLLPTALLACLTAPSQALYLSSTKSV